MKKSLIIAAMLLAWGGGALAQGGRVPQRQTAPKAHEASAKFDAAPRRHVANPNPSPDSVRLAETSGVVEISQISVSANRAGEKTPVAHTELTKNELERVSTSAVDVPYMLTATPSVVVHSDSGTGIGYTSMSVRGTDHTRINVTANGVPLGDGESQKHFWVNVPDLASSAGTMQIQRGVGTSTNGAGAFGANINLTTEFPQTRPFAELSGSYGSWNTHRESLRFGTGLIGGRWVATARLSNIGSDGYIDRASADLKSYFAQAAWLGRTTTVRLLSFGGREATYHAWSGATREQMEKYGRRYNPEGVIYLTDRFGFQLDKDGNQIDGEKNNNPPVPIGFYPYQKDFYTQYNFQALVEQRLTDRWSLSLTGHYTRGDGYYEQYKSVATLAKYGLAPYYVTANEDGTGDAVKVKKSDLVRRKAMWNNFGGAIASAAYRARNLDLTFGGAWSRYGGDHFGQVLWVKNYASGGLAPNHEYYRNCSAKHDANIFARASLQIARGVTLWGDFQWRHIDHRIGGTNDEYVSVSVGMQPLHVARRFDFFNPKAGVYYTIDRHHSLYASFAVAHKEPTRDNYTEGKFTATPRAERLLDTELGYKLHYERVTAEVGLYYMSYRDQLVKTGELNEIGEALAANVPKSFRAGIEMSLAWQVAPWLRWSVFGTLSRNRILDYTEFLPHIDAKEYPIPYDGPQAVTSHHVGNTDIAFSPAITAGNVLTFIVKGFYGALQTNFVGRQYLTNSSRRELSLDPYCTTNLRASYRFKLPHLKHLEVGVTVTNLFNARYESSGWGSSALQIVEGHEPTVINYAGYFPQATIGATGSITLSF